MEAKEFMLNDLVYRKEHKEFHKPVPRSVVKIDGVMDNDMITFDPNSEFLAMDEIEPITLTTEIVEKNGWFEIFKRAYEGHISLAQEPKSFRIKNTSICLHSVHELQHALRLVGLNDVADNLKV